MGLPGIIANPGAVPACVLRVPDPLLLCWDESFLCLLRVVTNLVLSPLAVICTRAPLLLALSLTFSFSATSPYTTAHH